MVFLTILTSFRKMINNFVKITLVLLCLLGNYYDIHSSAAILSDLLTQGEIDTCPCKIKQNMQKGYPAKKIHIICRFIKLPQ